MSREIYVPIADSFFESSIMREDLTVRFVMLALIRLGLRAGAKGIVDIDPFIFAQSINIPFDEVQRAIKRLMEPDPSSSSPDEDGRRIVPVDPARPFRNWRLVNWGRYKNIVHRATDAARKRHERAHGEDDSMDTLDTSENVQKRPPVSENGATNTNTKTITKTSKERGGRFAPPTLAQVRTLISEKGYHFTAEAFHAFYESNGWRVGKNKMRSWQAACVTWEADPRRQGVGSAGGGSRPGEAPKLKDGRYRLPSGWWASEDGLTIEKDFEVYERRSGASGMRYVHESEDDGVGFYVNGASIRSSNYTDVIRAREKAILKGHPRFLELFPEERKEAIS